MILTNLSRISVIITAAGSSTRMGGSVKKEYLPYKNGTVLSNCAKNFLKALPVKSLIITTPKNGMVQSKEVLFSDSEFSELITQTGTKVNFVEGSGTRQASVFNALDFVKNNFPDTEIVLIHDGARPFVTEELIQNSYEAACNFGASVPGVTPTDTQKEIDENGFIIRHLVRKNLCAVQTPQCFDFSRLYQAHVQAIKDGQEYTDDTEIWGKYCGQVKVVAGDVNNIKITYPSDLEKLS